MSGQVTQVDGAAIVEQKQDTLDESKEIVDKVDEPKESSKISEVCQESKETSEKLDEQLDQQSSGHNLKVLLGLNLDSDNNETVPLGVLKSSGGVASKPVSSGPPTKPSVSFDTSHACGDQFSKAVGSARDQSVPLLDRMMRNNGQSGGIDPGYGSFEPNRFASLSQDVKSKPREDFRPPFVTTRPTTPSVIELDIAVANALHNLQTLQVQEQRASVLGSAYLGRPDLNNNDPHNILSALLTGPVPQPLLLHQPYQKPLQFSMSEQPTYRHSNLHNIQPGNYLENAARSYRAAATVHEATCTWSGKLPPRASGSGDDLSFSSKVFLGGIPWDITEESLVHIFGQFGPVRVEWPGRDITTPPKGYLYVTFDSEESVKDLLTRCTHDLSDGGSFYYYKISSRMRSKEVQVIPWAVADSNFVRCPTVRLDPSKTVFVGALHGMINAEGLAIVFNDLFGGVVYAGLDTDKHKYPIGSGRVTFNNAKSYMKAVTAAFIEIKTPRFSKKVQVDPYLEDALCNSCGTKQGPYFCRDISCFKYFCRFCWELRHAFLRPPHKPLMRHIRGINRERWDSCYMDTRSSIPKGSLQNPARGVASSGWEFMRSTQSPVSHMATPSREPSSHMATPSREPSSHMATPSREPSSHMATPSREPSSHMATPSREPSSHMATPSREPSSHMATPSREPSSHMATPSREPSSHMATPSMEPSSHMATPSRVPSSHMATPNREPISHMATPNREPRSHMATSSREPSSHMATPSREPISHMATPSREPSSHMATPSREPSSHMATPSREPSSHMATPMVEERVLPSRAAFPGRVANLAEAGFTRWNPRKDAPEFDPVLPRSKAIENRKTTRLTLDIFITNVMKNEPGDRIKNGKEPKNGSTEEETKEIETSKNDVEFK